MHIGIGIGLDKIRRAVAAIFSPLSLFSNSEQGVWYDPSDVNVNWRRNLLTYTEEFDNAAWLKTNATVTANSTTAPDGTLTADKLVSSGTSQQVVRQTPSGTGVTQTFTIRAKADDASWIAIGTNQYADYLAWFDLSTGTVGTKNSNIISHEITSLTNGWHLCSITAVFTSGGYVSAQVTSGDNTVSPPSASTGIYIWGAQLEVGDTATAYQRIVTPEITYVADVQPQPILYQDSAGTTPVTAVEQPVGLMLDKSQGLVLGSELVDTANTAAAWTAYGTNIVEQDGDAVKVTYVDNSGGAFIYLRNSGGLSSDLVAGTSYQITAEMKVNAGSTVDLRCWGAVIGFQFNSVSSTEYQTVKGTLIYQSGNAYLYFVSSMSAGEIVWIRNISVRELPGNHATQTTLLARPTLSAKYNLLTYTEQFDNAAWAATNITVGANTTAAPDGTTTAYTLTQSVVSNTTVQLAEVITITAGVPYTLSCYIKNIDETDFIRLQLGSGNQGSGFGISVDPVDMSVDDSSAAGTGYTYISHSVTSVGDGWYHLSVTGSSSTTTAVAVYIAFRDVANNRLTNGGTGSIYIWGADLRVSNDGVDLPAYQRVDDTGTTGNYDTVGFPLYLKFDGVDDSLATNSIDFTATDKVTVWSGVRKLSDAAQGMLVELSASIASNNGTFGIQAPQLTLTNRFSFLSKGTSLGQAHATGSAYNAPVTGVLSGIGDISGDVTTIRINGIQAATSSTDQGTGNYGNYPLYIGSRAGSSIRFNGRIYELIVRGAESTATEITDTEDWVNNVTKAWS